MLPVVAHLRRHRLISLHLRRSRLLHHHRIIRLIRPLDHLRRLPLADRERRRDHRLPQRRTPRYRRRLPIRSHPLLVHRPRNPRHTQVARQIIQRRPRRKRILQLVRPPINLVHRPLPSHPRLHLVLHCRKRLLRPRHDRRHPKHLPPERRLHRTTHSLARRRKNRRRQLVPRNILPPRIVDLCRRSPRRPGLRLHRRPIRPRDPRIRQPLRHRLVLRHHHLHGPLLRTAEIRPMPVVISLQIGISHLDPARHRVRRQDHRLDPPQRRRAIPLRIVRIRPLQLILARHRRRRRRRERQLHQLRHPLLPLKRKHLVQQHLRRLPPHLNRLHQLPLRDVAPHQLDEPRLRQVVLPQHLLERRLVERPRTAPKRRNVEHSLPNRLVRHHDPKPLHLVRDRRLDHQPLHRLPGNPPPHRQRRLALAAHHPADLLHPAPIRLLKLRRLDRAAAHRRQPGVPAHVTNHIRHAPKHERHDQHEEERLGIARCKKRPKGSEHRSRCPKNAAP